MGSEIIASIPEKFWNNPFKHFIQGTCCALYIIWLISEDEAGIKQWQWIFPGWKGAENGGKLENGCVVAHADWYLRTHVLDQWLADEVVVFSGGQFNMSVTILSNITNSKYIFTILKSCL